MHANIVHYRLNQLEIATDGIGVEPARAARAHQRASDGLDDEVPFDVLQSHVCGHAIERHVAVHAIGDQANDDILDIYEEVAKLNGARDRRFRVEHAQHLTPSAIPRFQRQQVIPSMEPYHAIDDGRWAVKRVGTERLRGSYAFKSLLESGARLCFGSDWPVAPFAPLTGIAAAVLRQTTDGANPGGWLPEQRITVDQALTAYTASNAYAGFQEDRLGRIVPGYIADLVVLDKDLLHIDPQLIAETKVLRTIVDGKERFVASGVKAA